MPKWPADHEAKHAAAARKGWATRRANGTAPAAKPAARRAKPTARTAKPVPPRTRALLDSSKARSTEYVDLLRARGAVRPYESGISTAERDRRKEKLAEIERRLNRLDTLDNRAHVARQVVAERAGKARGNKVGMREWLRKHARLSDQLAMTDDPKKRRSILAQMRRMERNQPQGGM